MGYSMSWLDEEEKKDVKTMERKKVTPAKKEVSAKKLTANPPHGEKGGFVRMTVTMPPEVYELLNQEVTRRKITKSPDPTVSAILREAAVAYLK